MARTYEGIREDVERGTWTARYRFAPGPKGMRSKRGFASQGEAKQWRDKAVGKLASGQSVDPRDSRQTVGTIAKEWLALREVDPMTAFETYRTYVSYWNSALAPTFADMPLANLTRASILVWQTQRLATGLAPRTVGYQQTVLGQIVEFALAKEAIAHNYVRDVPRPKARGIVPPADPDAAAIGAVIAAVEPRYRIVLELAAFAGLRGGEARGLALDDVVPMPDGRAQLHIHQQLGLKGLGPVKGNRGQSRPRTIVIDADLAQSIQDHVRQYGTAQPGDLIVSHPSGRPLSPSAWRRVFVAACDAAGVERPDGTGAHMLRHAFASFAIAAGVDPAQLAGDLGHANTNTTFTYYVQRTARTEAASSAARAAIARTPRARHGLRAV